MKQFAATRENLEALRQLALKHGNFDAIKAQARKYGNFGAITQLALAPKSIGRKFATAFAIALASAAVALWMSVIPPLSGTVQQIDGAIYDAFYKRRTQESKYNGHVVIVAVDDSSIARMVQGPKHRWPWPRDMWAAVLAWMEKCGAKVVVFDLLFEEPSYYEPYVGDDTAFAKALDAARIPVVIAQRVTNEPAPFALPVAHKPIFGAVNLEDTTQRFYQPQTLGVPALAFQAVRKAGGVIPPWANQPFLLHYYGPTRTQEGKPTFHHVPALEVVLASQPEATPIPGISPELFRDRIVVIGTTANATYDVKSSPIDDKPFPGMEIQATAIANLLDNLRVQRLGWAITLSTGFLAALIAAAGAVIPKNAWIKLTVPLLAIGAAYLAGDLLFVQGRNIYWLPLAVPILACVFATLAALAWTYLVEDRQRRVLRRFLAQYVSPEVAEELDRRGTISLGGVRREVTLLFTDIAGFTSLTEQMESDKLEQFMNFYLSEMSAVVFGNNGTLDKYIGDAIMTFWNAPLDQPNHAALACRTALGIHHREEEIRPLLAQFGAEHIYTRLGVNTGLANVGNYGSLQKLNYTVLGDNVNLASRLEGANKIYGTRILVAQTTVDQVKNQFLFRQLDLLRVPGKKKPMAVYELMAEGAGDANQQRIATDFNAAFAAYQHQQWDAAERILVALNEIAPDDGPTQTLLKRVRGFRDHPPPADWDGVHIAKEK